MNYAITWLDNVFNVITTYTETGRSCRKSKEAVWRAIVNLKDEAKTRLALKREIKQKKYSVSWSENKEIYFEVTFIPQHGL
jgi:hypothetical protein